MWRGPTWLAFALVLVGCGLDALVQPTSSDEAPTPTPQAPTPAEVSSRWVKLAGAPAGMDPQQCDARWVYDQLFLWSSPMDRGACSPQRWDPVSGNWLALTVGHAPEPIRWAAAGASGKLVVYGQDSGGLNDTVRYNPVSDGWEAVRSHEFGHRVVNMGALSTGRGVIFWGGHGLDAAETMPLRAAAAVYYADTDEWMVMPEENEPALRTQHTTHWDGMHMVVFGGRDLDGRLLDDAYLWDQEGNVWERFEGEGGPSARTDAAATFTGSHYVFFGGTSDGDSYLNDGAVYHWDKVDWLPMPPAEGFVPRHPVAFWTGDHVLVLQTTDAPLVAAQYDLDSWSWSPVELHSELNDFVVVRASWDLKDNRGLLWGYHATTASPTQRAWEAWAYEPPGDPPPPSHQGQR
jgi:hypothetical protein